MNDLKHYGVLGMKWGIRRYQPYGQGYESKQGGRFVGVNSKKAERIANRFERKIERNKRYGDRLYNTRSGISKIKENRFDKKIEKIEKTGDQNLADIYKKKKEYKMYDYDSGTKMYRNAQNNIDKFLKEYGQMKIDAVSDPSIKKTSSYRNMGLTEVSRVLSNINYGPSYTYAIEALNADRNASYFDRDFSKSYMKEQREKKRG